MNNMNTIKKHYYNLECEICKNHNDLEKNDTIIRLERSLTRIIDEISNDSRILTFTYNLKKTKIIGNYSRCKNTKRFIDNKQFYFDIYLNWLYFLKNNNSYHDYDYYSGKIKKLSNIVYYINQEKNKSGLKYKKLNCFKAINHLESLLIFFEKDKYINFSMTNNCTSFKKLGVVHFSKLDKIKNKNNFLYTFIKFKKLFIDNNFIQSTKKQTNTKSVTSNVKSISNDSVISDIEKLVLEKTEIINYQKNIIEEQNLVIVQQNSSMLKLKKDLSDSIHENKKLKQTIELLTLQNINITEKYESNIRNQISRLKNNVSNLPLDTSTSVNHNFAENVNIFEKKSPSGVEASSWKTFPNNGNLDLCSNTYLHNDSILKPSGVPVVPPGFNESSNNLFEQNVRYQEQYTQPQHQKQYNLLQHQEQYTQPIPPLINYQGSPQVQDYNYNGW